MLRESIIPLMAGLCLPAMLHAWSLESQMNGQELLLQWSMTESASELSLNGESWMQLELAGCLELPEAGAPAFPFVSELIQLDPGHELRVSLENPVWETLSGKPLPVQNETGPELNGPSAWVIDQQIYGSRLSFPAEQVTAGETFIARGTSMAQLGLVPARFDAASSTISLLREATLRVTQLESPDVIQPLRSSVDALPGLVPAARPELATQQNLREMQSNLPGAYLVFARNSVVQNNAYLQSLLAWKQDKGHTVTVAGESEVGSWTASAIKNYISNAYANWEEAPAFVMLVGDPSASGDYNLPTNGTGYSGQYDHAYACVDGSDIYGDVAVGRLSVENATQLGTMCNKILYYETTPTMAGTAWLEGAALTTGWDAISMIQQSRTIVNDMVEEGITDVDTLWYPNSDAGDVNNWFNQGIALYNYRGWIGMDGLSNSFIDSESNFINYGMPPVVAIFTCATGDFDGTCETEAFMRKGDVSTPRGSAACMGFATANTHTAYNNAVAGGFWSSFLDHGVAQVGPSMFAGKATLAENLPDGDANAEHFSNWANLMGDPGMDMWCGVPAALSVTLDSGSSFALGSGMVEATVTAGGQPVERATVCLRQSGFVSRGQTDAAGHVLLSVENAVAGSVALTASKPDFLPDRETVTASTQSFLAMVDFQPAGDGLVQPGETVSLSPLVQNAGTSTISGLSATLVSLSSAVTVNDGTASWSNSISAGQQAAASNTWQITVSGDATDLAEVPLAISYTWSGGSSSDIAGLGLSNPLFQASSYAFTPGGSSLLPGVTSSLALDLGNVGNMAASGFTFNLSTSDAFVSIDGGSDTGTIAVGGSATLDFTVSVDALAVRGHRAIFELNWSGAGMSGLLSFSATVGAPGATSPTGPDGYGYFAHEDTDASSLAPSYQWIEIAPSVGGGGTNLNLSDYGDEQDDAATINLPFDVVYYGIAYSEVAVCSNGFIAFEPGAVNQTDYRNHHLPSGLGPDAMIAAAWDDHILSGGSSVSWKHDALNHRVIIEWYQMQHNGSGSTNTFQIVLMDPDYHQTPTGDSPILLQYNDWNNTQSNSYDFPGCSVGIKDEHSLNGMTLTNYQIDDPSISGFYDGKAILITTDEGTYLTGTDNNPPAISVVPVGTVQPGVQPTLSATITDPSGVAFAEAHWRVVGGSWQSDYMTHGTGDTWYLAVPAQPLNTVVEYYVTATDLAVPQNSGTSSSYSYTVVAGNPPTGPDGYGYSIYDVDDALEATPYLWHDISAMGSALGLGDDQTATVNLPFSAVYYGNSFSQVSVCSNGFIVMGNDSYSSYSNYGLASGNGTNNMIAPFWDDLNPSSSGQVRVADLGDGRFVIAWLGVPHYGTSSYETFQLVIHDPSLWQTQTGDSKIVMQYHQVSDVGGCSVGMQDGSSNVGIQYLYNGSYGSFAASITANQSLTITTGTPALQPVGTVNVNVAGSNIVLSWEDVGAPSYNIYTDSDAYGSFSTLLRSTSETSFGFIPGGSSAYYQVRSSSESLLAARSSWQPVIVYHPATNKTDGNEE